MSCLAPSPGAALGILKSMGIYESVNIFIELSAEMTAKILEEMDHIRAGEVLNHMPCDISVAILSQMPAGSIRGVLSKMDAVGLGRIQVETTKVFPMWSEVLDVQSQVQGMCHARACSTSGMCSPWQLNNMQSPLRQPVANEQMEKYTSKDQLFVASLESALRCRLQLL